jgi:hypothetical protein
MHGCLRQLEYVSYHAFLSTAITHNCYLTQEKYSLIKQTIIVNYNRISQAFSCVLISY